MSGKQPSIVYTLTDEAPALATHSFLPVIRAFAGTAGIDVELSDISLAARILACFPERLNEAQRISDHLSELGALARTADANIIKLPNISASIPQLTATIRELQDHGYDVPDYPDEPRNADEESIRSRYAGVLGSAVNPVLREGNSDRRVAQAVKDYARKHPHRLGAWKPDARSHVAHMDDGDFFSSEQSFVMESAGEVRIELVTQDGNTKVLRDSIPLQAGEVIDSASMNCSALRSFFEREIQNAREEDLLLSLHLKATMMKVSDPIIFGHAVTVFYKDVFEKHAEIFKTLGVEPKNGLGDVYKRIAELDDAQRAEIEADIAACYAVRPRLAMVNSDKGITNLHVPSDVIIDASMPVFIRDSGCMWGPDGNLHETKALIPDRCYAGVYQEMVNFCRENGAFDVTTMGNVSNVGLMAQKAEEYGSHDKTFEIPEAGTVRIVDTSTGSVLTEHGVQQGDIWRACQTKDAPIRDWVRLAVSRARATGAAAIFWLNSERAHDANLITRVKACLEEHDTTGLDISIQPPVQATRTTCERARKGLDTISVTGNVLRDYLTDLFPILELGTSAKMLSIVPLLQGGGLFETGAGGSAPKHVQQFVEEGHLRWDSLGEFLALAVSFEMLAEKTGDSRVQVLAAALDEANGKYLENSKTPSRKVNEIDNRGSHFYLAMYWAQAMAARAEDPDAAARFSALANALSDNEERINDELLAAQGSPVEIGGYYQPDIKLVTAAMRPSETFNRILSEF